jgi:hypothetical protein
MDLVTGEVRTLTRSSGTKFRPIESNGYVYFYKPGTNASFAGIRTASRVQSIFRVPSGGGEEELVVDRIPYHYWDLWEGNLIYVRFTEEDEIVIEMMDPTNSTKHLLRKLSPETELPHELVPYMPVSPDGRWILLTKNDLSGSDLMMVDFAAD